MQTKRYTCFLVLILIVIFATACNKTAETGNQGTPTPTGTSAPTLISFPLTTLPPTPTPVPLKEVALSQCKFDECSVIDCDEYYFEMLSFKEQDEGGYAIETVFENRQNFAVVLVISDVHVNLLKPTWFDLKYYDWEEFVYSYDGEEKVIKPGEKKTIEFWLSDAYAKRLKITDITDLNCVQFEFMVESVDDTAFDYYDINWIMYYSNGRERVMPYEHVLSDDDIVLVDREDVKLYLTDFIYDEDGSCYVYFYWENNTTRLLYYNFYQQAINGYEQWNDLNYFEEVTLGSGMGGYDFFILSASDIKKSGEASVSEFEFDVYLSYYEGLWHWEEIVEETFTVYPLERRAVQKEKYEPFSKNNELFDTKYYKLVYNGYLTEKRQSGETEYTDYYIQVYFENKSAQKLQLLIPDAKLNGIDYTNELNYRTVSSGEGADIKFKWTDTGEVFSEFSDLKALELNILIKNLDDEEQGIVSETRLGVSP